MLGVVYSIKDTTPQKGSRTDSPVAIAVMVDGIEAFVGVGGEFSPDALCAIVDFSGDMQSSL